MRLKDLVLMRCGIGESRPWIMLSIALSQSALNTCKHGLNLALWSLLNLPNYNKFTFGTQEGCWNLLSNASNTWLDLVINILACHMCKVENVTSLSVGMRREGQTMIGAPTCNTWCSQAVSSVACKAVIWDCSLQIACRSLEGHLFMPCRLHICLNAVVPRLHCLAADFNGKWTTASRSLRLSCAMYLC